MKHKSHFQVPLIGAIFAIASAIMCMIAWSDDNPLPSWLGVLAWSVAQWMPISSVSQQLQQKGWESCERNHDQRNAPVLEIPRISIQDQENPLEYLEATYGKDWRDRPLLFVGLWNSTFLNDRRRRLSLQGLLQENLTIPYFSDARVYGSLSPDAEAPVQEIVERIAQGFPHKIGTQLLVQKYPELLQEVAPLDILTKLFGNHFNKNRLLGHAKILGIFPGTTTVPVFIAHGRTSLTKNDFVETTVGSPEEATDEDKPFDPIYTASLKSASRPLTGLHCEPIGNVAVQLSGVKEWTLVDPKYSFQLRPSVASDGRAYFASLTPTFDHVPRYHIAIHAGDAMWVPTWTWHRVDYVDTSSDISIGASLFHFRPMEFLRRNPLYALLSIPALVQELVGISTQ
jgi:hypothetical protein